MMSKRIIVRCPRKIKMIYSLPKDVHVNLIYFNDHDIIEFNHEDYDIKNNMDISYIINAILYLITYERISNHLAVMLNCSCLSEFFKVCDILQLNRVYYDIILDHKVNYNILMKHYDLDVKKDSSDIKHCDFMTSTEYVDYVKYLYISGHLHESNCKSLRDDVIEQINNFLPNIHDMEYIMCLKLIHNNIMNI